MYQKNRIYADYASTTPLSFAVRWYMYRASRFWANPSSIYGEGVSAKRKIAYERSRIAETLGVKPYDVYVTSGGTESNVTIMRGVVEARRRKGIPYSSMHIVTSAMEHSSILSTARLLEGDGVRVTYIKPDDRGVIDPQSVISAILPDTVLVTLMYVNNEIGTIARIGEIGSMIRALRLKNDSPYPVFHTDASQAPLWLPCVLEGLRVDAMTLDAHKMEGPKGVGLLIARSRVDWEPLLVGGGQERGRRSTTENIEAISGCAEALVRAQRGNKNRTLRVTKYRDMLMSFFEKKNGVVINGTVSERVANNINVSFLNITSSEMLVLFLDKMGISLSTKSSCLKDEEDSYVVSLLGGDRRRKSKTLRITLSPDVGMSTVRRIMRALDNLPDYLYSK